MTTKFFRMKLLLVVLGCLALCLTVFSQQPEADVETVENEDASATSEEIKSEAVKNTFKPPTVPDSAFFALYFSAPSDLATQLTISQAKKDGVEAAISKYDGQWSVEVPSTSALLEDYGLVLRSKAKHHAVSALLKKPFDFKSKKQFIMQYEVKFENGQECGGAYVKLTQHDPSFEPSKFNDKTPYTIMFGPDKCGMDHKLHFIFQHKNPKTNENEEKHAKKPKGSLENYFTDKKSHLYTLVLNSDNSFEIFVDQTLVNSGSMLEDFEPSVNPPKEIDDPNDKKDESWDERPKIADADAKKPDDWDETEPEFIEDEAAKKPDGWLDDEPTMIADAKSVKPKDWDNDMDGEWEAPKIDNPKCKEAPGCGTWKIPKIKNPKYKGKWSAPMIDNPSYKGIWKPRKIPNPNYFEDSTPFQSLASIGGLGLELWSMSDNIVFDNFLVTDSKSDADLWAEATWGVKKVAENRIDPSAQSVVDAIRDLTNEKPWIWAVIMLVVVLPIILIIAYCCLKGDKSDAAARSKKTDEPSADDEEEEDSDGKDEDAAIEEVAPAASLAPAGDSGTATETKAATTVKRRSKRGGKAELETAPSEEDSEMEAAAAVAAPLSNGTSSGKRRTRKD